MSVDRRNQPKHPRDPKELHEPPGLPYLRKAALAEQGECLRVLSQVARLRDRIDDLPAHDAVLVDDERAPVTMPIQRKDQAWR